LHAFSEDHQLAGNPTWHAPRGDREMLEAVWLAYGVYGGSGGMRYSDADYVIDPAGRDRVFTRADFDPEALVHNLRAVLA
jgi:cytochrome oxidase Cu insertion factor (SCO1/SenC/PrrC family)